MRRWLPLAIIIAALAIPATASATLKACEHKAKTPTGVKALIKCAAPKLGVSTSTALDIAWRESNYKPWVCNASNHCGVYQDATAIWNTLVSNYVFGHSLDPLVRTNGRANVILNLRYVKHHGWGPWGG